MRNLALLSFLAALAALPLARSVAAQGAKFGCQGSGTASSTFLDPDSQVLMTLTVHIYDGICDVIETPDGPQSVQEPCSMLVLATARGYKPPVTFNMWSVYPDGSRKLAAKVPVDFEPVVINPAPIPVTCGKVFRIEMELPGVGSTSVSCSCSICETP